MTRVAPDLASEARSELRKPPGEIRAPLVRAAALIALIVLVDVWMTHHYGWNLEQLVALGGIAALVSGALPYVKSALSKADQRAAEGLGRRVLRTSLSTPLLAILWTSFAIAVLTVSSVTVMSDAPDSVDSVSVAFPDRAEGAKVGSVDQNAAKRFHIFTTPLGRPIRIAAPGFVPTSFTLYPLTGLTIMLGREVPVAPALLFRPDHQALVALKNGGAFRAWVTGSGSDVVIAETSGVRSSFMVGEAQGISNSMVDDWRLELACDTAETRNRILRAWRYPVSLPLKAPAPGPGTVLRAEVRARNRELVARTQIVLGDDRLIDVPVFDVQPDPGSCR